MKKVLLTNLNITKTIILILTALVATVASGQLTNAPAFTWNGQTNPPPLTVQWQYDDIRAKLKKYEEQKAFVAEFRRTNTDRYAFVILDALTFQCNATTNDIKTGYRSDGVVVWRRFPENIHVGGF